MRRAVLLLTLAFFAFPAVASASPNTTASTPVVEYQRIESVTVRPESVYIEEFAERLAQRRDHARRAFEDAKRRRTFFTSATQWEKRLWDKTELLGRSTYPETGASEAESAITATN